MWKDKRTNEDRRREKQNKGGKRGKLKAEGAKLELKRGESRKKDGWCVLRGEEGGKLIATFSSSSNKEERVEL